ncbi:uncharacterized protein LOC131869725 [Cryptomeria japonica]|uniref:uncharacterized protein LOC131869725 n=1 Tax=Cryptomeria japonica TaxID=3369 RepID=UPI0027DA97C7|nr:uncharacterized protein LOC131869725 [Cryptomeria japonica]
MNDGVIQLKGNKIPKGLVSLERLFDRHDAFKKGKDERIPVVQDAGGYERVNIGIEENPKYVNLGKCCTPAEKERFTSLLLEYKDVFSWCYDDLKNFREGKFHHHIPLNPGTSPFQQKLINFNHKVAEAIFQEISVSESDQHKISFITPWGTFAYNRMPFGLINARETFQRAMDLSFGHLEDKIIVIYIDDLIVFSKRRKHHLRDLRQVLQRCREHGVTLNPKKSAFGVTKGKLLGHTISKE